MVVGFAMRRLCDGARDRGVRLTERAYMSDSVLLTCPKCHHVLDRKVTGSVEVDVCGACGGLWLDRAELVRLKLFAEPWEISLVHEPGIRNVPPTSKLVRLACPRCGDRLSIFELAEVAVDICDGCRGIWLDRGELKPALKALTRDAAADVLDALLGVAKPPGGEQS